jgi:hypothetical protein
MLNTRVIDFCCQASKMDLSTSVNTEFHNNSEMRFTAKLTVASLVMADKRDACC